MILDNKEENMQQAREEESHWKPTSYFQFTLNEIQVHLEQCEIHNAKLQQENTELGGKLMMLTEECTLSKEVKLFSLFQFSRISFYQKLFTIRCEI